MHSGSKSVSVQTIILIVVLYVGGAALSSCGNQSDPIAMSLGNAYVGSANLQLYTELEAGADISAELKFGDPVRLLRRRRNFYFVRGPAGAEGWTHRTNLFNERQVSEMRALAQWAAGAFPQGEARVFATLNVHNHPNRSAPTIFQIHEDERVTFLAHERHAREPYNPGPLVETAGVPPERSTEKPASSEANEDEGIAEPPSPPEAPPVPSSWLRLSGLSTERIASLAEEGILDGPSVPSSRSSGELWTLVRNADGLAGWALQSRLVAAIPDTVAQYSEGARITSYFALAPAGTDGKQNHWLWTTLKTSNAAYTFDSYRVFIWNSRLHRFETSLIVRDVEGYLPVEISKSDTGVPRFRLAVRERGGLIFRRTYELNGMHTRLVQSVPWPNYDPLRQPNIMQRLPELPSVLPLENPGNPGVWENTKSGINDLFARIFGG